MTYQNDVTTTTATATNNKTEIISIAASHRYRYRDDYDNDHADYYDDADRNEYHLLHIHKLPIISYQLRAENC